MSAYLGMPTSMYNYQNTGIGNSVNSIVSLCNIPNASCFLNCQSTPGEPVGAQGGMASVTEDILNTFAYYASL